MNAATNANRELRLLLPDYSALDVLYRSAQPFALWPVGNRLLLEHWMDWAVRENFGKVSIWTVDRPNEIRDALADGHYWSKEVNVTALRSPDDAPAGARLVTSLPGDQLPEPATAEELVTHWLKLNLDWVGQFPQAEGPVTERKHSSGAWIGPGVRIAPSARLTPPVWIGAASEVGPGSRIGPGVIIGEHCILDEDVEAQNSLILPHSYAGAHIGLKDLIIDGGVLINTAHGVRVDIAESFILGRPVEDDPPPSLLSRLVAATAWLGLALPALLLSSPQAVRPYVYQQESLELSEGSRGRLILRRWSWLMQVVLGRFHWFGILPRSIESLDALPGETAERIRNARLGVFSLADAHGVHSAEDEDEWVHAAYQTLANPNEIRQLLRKSWWSLAWTNPDE